jgi:hypothetical protein
MLAVALCFAFSVAWSRIVTGMHSFNQILFGMSLGAWLAFSFYGILYEPLLQHCFDMLNNKAFTEENRKSGHLRNALWCTLWFGTLMVIQITNYFIVNPQVVPQQLWETNIAADCGASALNSAFMALALV